jgi:hypothetical protein
MAKGMVRLLIGTRKGGFIAESDVRRRKWEVRGPVQPGTEVFHMVADPRHPGHIYSLANSWFFGPLLYRSSDGGRKWSELSTPLMPRSSKRPSPLGPEPPKRPIANLWHLEPGPAGEPRSMFLGVDPGSLFRTDDLAKSWTPVSALNEHPTREKWNPGAGGMCTHTILLDPSRPHRMYVGISAAGTFRTDDSGEHWTPMNHGVAVSFLPEKHPEVGQCVHDVTLDPAHPETLYRQDHDGIYVSHDSAESWKRIGRSLPYDFGFVVAAPAASPGNAFFVPLDPKYRITREPGLQVWKWADGARKWSPTMRSQLWPGTYGTHREGLTTDALDPFGLYLGTTTGELFFSNDAARSWSLMPYHFPAIHSVAVQNPEP